MDALLTLPQFAAFLAAAAFVTLAPGPDNLMLLSIGMARGRRQGMAFGLGCASGCLNHTALAALGVSALIAASLWAFTALKIAGGLYLIWLGAQALRNARGMTLAPAGAAPCESVGRFFVKGLIANAINPKVVLFFLAFLPQFVDTARGHVAWQIAQLGLVFTLQGALLFGAIGWFSGSVGRWLARRPGMGAWLDRAAGGIFVLLGLRLIASR
ncbi:MAG: LysE family translocator [Rhodocyclaceae bacterium]|nr:LysE family translocator [Rhodocyclaceae bacterium]